jgi:hypothetical protein
VADVVGLWLAPRALEHADAEPAVVRHPRLGRGGTQPDTGQHGGNRINGHRGVPGIDRRVEHLGE